MTGLEFSKDDLELLGNSDILVQKRILQDKVFSLLASTRNLLASHVGNQFSTVQTGKISRGENYMSLPYLVLDYPAIFSGNDIMACRTMFLWGNFFSTTLHLQGKYLEANRQKILSISNRFDPTGLYVSCGNTPWQYHYEPDNYAPMTPKSLEKSISRDFFKLSRRIPLEDYNSLPEIAKEFYLPLLGHIEI